MFVPRFTCKQEPVGFHLWRFTTACSGRTDRFRLHTTSHERLAGPWTLRVLGVWGSRFPHYENLLMVQKGGEESRSIANIKELALVTFTEASKRIESGDVRLPHDDCVSHSFRHSAGCHECSKVLKSNAKKIQPLLNHIRLQQPEKNHDYTNDIHCSIKYVCPILHICY